MKIFIEIILPILADIFLVFIVAFFAASETAFLSITRVTLHQMLKKEGDKKNTPAKKNSIFKKRYKPSFVVDFDWNQFCNFSGFRSCRNDCD